MHKNAGEIRARREHSLPLSSCTGAHIAIGTGKDERKRQRTLAFVDCEGFDTSAQVSQEFFVTVVKKAARPLSAGQTLEGIEHLITVRVTRRPPDRGIAIEQ